MPQYLISVLHAPGAQASGDVYANEEEMNAAFQKVGEFNESLGDKMVFACGLTPPEKARTVEKDGTVTGPAAPESPAQLGGLWVVEAADDDEALEITRRGQSACGQRLEVRRLQG